MSAVQNTCTQPLGLLHDIAMEAPDIDVSVGTVSPPAMPHILVVEDDTGTRTLLARFLSENGFRATGARNGAEMWESLTRLTIDLVLLDVMLPGASGLDLCRELRRTSVVPIIMLTAKTAEFDRVRGLELGADDYVPKPFSRAELLARIRAVLRRGQLIATNSAGPRDRYLRFEAWVLDTARHELKAPDGAMVELSGAEYAVLLAFLEHPQRVLTRDRILELSRNRIGEVFDRSVDVLVSRLRRKLGGLEEASELIKTVRGTGYLFSAEVVRQ
jgi:two-component system OmpR family response regulator